MKKMILCFLGFCLLACTSNADKAGSPIKVQHLSENPSSSNDGVVTLISTYTDHEHGQKKVVVKGSGFLVKAGAKTLVVTASHVSQGEGVEIQYQGNALRILGRQFLQEADLEVLEVSGSIKTPFLMHEKAPFIEWTSQEIGRARWIDAFDFVLMNDWVDDPNLTQDNRFAKTQAHQFACDMNCQLLQSVSLTQPGSSGSPLVTKIPEAGEWQNSILYYDLREWVPVETPGRYFVRGLVIRRDRFFARSAFVPTQKIVKAIEAYVQGKPVKPFRPVRWTVSGPLMLRIFDEHLFESAGASGASGNGVSMDGGDLGDLKEESPNEVLSQISASPVNDGSPALYWLMAMRTPQGAMISSPLWFDMEHYIPLSRFVFNLGIRPGEKENILGQLTGRIGKKPRPESLISSDNQGVLKFAPGMMTVEVKTPENDPIKFMINTEGAYCSTATTCADRFQAIIEVPSVRGTIYLVDLRGLLFANPIFAKTELFRDPKAKSWTAEEWQKKSFDLLIEEINTSRLFYRKKRASNAPLNVLEGMTKEVAWMLPSQ